MLTIAVLKREANTKHKMEMAIDSSPETSEVSLILKRGTFYTDSNSDMLYYNNRPIDIENIDAVFSTTYLTPQLGTYLRYFERQGKLVLQPNDGVINARNKYYSHQYFIENKIRTPKTFFFYQDYPMNSDTEKLLVNYLGEYPFILKPSNSTYGRGVVLVNNYEELLATVKDNNYKSFLIQEYINPDRREDERHIVVGDRVVNSMLRVGKEGEIATNMHRGATGYPLKCDKETEELCIKATKAIGLLYGGVDVIRDKEGTPYVLEINTNPDTDITDINNYNHFFDVLDFVKKRLSK